MRFAIRIPWLRDKVKIHDWGVTAVLVTVMVSRVMLKVRVRIKVRVRVEVKGWE